MEKKFENKYGSAVLKTVTPFIPVSKIRGTDYSDDIKFSLDDAAKLALITDNNGIQICFEKFQKAYAVLHSSSSIAAVCMVEMNYTFNTDPNEEIERLKEPLNITSIQGKTSMITIEILKERLELFIEERLSAGNPIDRDVQDQLRIKINELTPLQLQALSIGNCNKLLECGYFCGEKRAKLCETAKEHTHLVFRVTKPN